MKNKKPTKPTKDIQRENNFYEEVEDVNETLDMVCTPQAMKMKQISLTYIYCETDVIMSVGQGLY